MALEECNDLEDLLVQYRCGLSTKIIMIINNYYNETPNYKDRPVVYLFTHKPTTTCILLRYYYLHVCSV